MSKNTLIIVVVTAIIVLIAAPKLRSLPGVSKLPTI
jgi:Tfp pilus assembly protein FimT